MKVDRYTVPRLGTALCRKLVGDRAFRVRTRWGGRIGVRPGLAVNELLMLCLGGFAAELSNLLMASLQPGDTFIDIGAHIGWFSVLAAHRIGPKGKLFAIEPELANFAQLDRNLAGAACAVETHRIALGANDSDVFLGKGDFSNLHSVRRANHEKQGWPVRMTTGDRLFARVNEVDYVKIDVEGLEVAVIAGMGECLRRWRHVRLVMEMNREYWSAQELRAAEQILCDLGLRVWSIERLRPWETRLPRLSPETSLAAVGKGTCDVLLGRDLPKALQPPTRG